MSQPRTADTIRRLLALSKAGRLHTRDGAAQLHQLVGHALDEHPDGAPLEPPGDYAESVVMQAVEALLPEYGVLAHLGGRIDWSKLLPVLVQLLGTVLASPRPRFARSYHRRHPHASGGYTPPQVAKLYNFPSGDGKGQKVAFVELGGAFSQSDLNGYMQSLGLTAPTVQLVALSTQMQSSDADAEVMLDLCVACAVAPGIVPVVYLAPNTDQGFAAAVQKAVDDNVDVISISWGAPEDQWSAPARAAMDQAFQAAANKGIPVLVASGDNGSSDGERRGNHVDYPASSPYVTGCGGTTLAAGGESVWNAGGGAAGGGVSTVYPLPGYQASAGVPGGKARGVPDVAGNADPATGYRVVVGGRPAVVGGTSAVAPLWAALCAILQQQLGRRLGPLNPKLYALPSCFKDITQGNNGTYTARAGWDACTGLGCPDGGKLLAALGPVAPPPPPPPPGSTTVSVAVAGFGTLTLGVPYPPAAVSISKS